MPRGRRSRRPGKRDYAGALPCDSNGFGRPRWVSTRLPARCSSGNRASPYEGHPPARVDQLHDAGLFGGPEVLPTPAQSVLALCEQLVEVLDESREVALPIVDAGVMVVGVGHREEHINAEPRGCVCKTVDEGVVRRR